MKYIKQLLYRIVAWFFPKKPNSKEHIQYLNDLPAYPDENIFYIIGSFDKPWLLAFNCPCGCNSLIQLNLLEEASPCWEFKITEENRMSISPSIHRTTGCRSHFFIKDSKVDWANSVRRH